MMPAQRREALIVVLIALVLTPLLWFGALLMVAVQS